MFDKLVVKLISPEIRLVKSFEGNFFDHETDTLHFDRHEGEGLGWFLRNLETAHECQFVNDIDPLMWTLLHEIGHFETAEIVDPEEDLANRALFAITSKEQARGDKELQDLYFSMDSEWQATEWAIDWVANHHKLAVALSWVLSK